MPISSLRTEDSPINSVITKIESGEIKLPPFQRSFVWDEDQVIALLDSIYKEYPIGCVIVWRSSDSLKTRRNIGGFLLPERPVKFPIDYILDGQQRITSIYALFCKDRTPVDSTTDEQYKVNPALFNIYFDLDAKKFITELQKDGSHKNLRISALFDTTKLFNEIDEFSPEYKAQSLELLQKFSNYNIPFVITTREKDDIGVIFERINNTGTNLSPINLMVAWTWDGDFQLKEIFDEILDYLGDKGFEEIPEKTLLQCLGAIIDKTAKTKDILKLDASKVRNNVDQLRAALEKAIDFLSTQLRMFSIDFLPHTHQIIPIVYFFAKHSTPPNVRQIETIKKWFWRTTFSNRYANSTDEKINEDIIFMDKVLLEDFSGLSRYSLTLDEALLLKQKFSRANPYTRGFLLLLAQKDPKNLTNGGNMDLNISLSTYNRKEYHHIFPKKFLESKGITIDAINLLCNFTFLPADSNKLISAKAPSDYFFNIVPPAHFEPILESNLIEPEKSIFSKDNYDAFLQSRAKKIMEYIKFLI